MSGVPEISDRVADDLDRAAEVTQQLTQDSLERVQRAAAPEQTQNEDGSWPYPDCNLCDEPIPAARLALGKIRCIACQHRWERGDR